MNILITFFPIDDMGGIINHHEQLCAGLQELGHTVTTKMLVWKYVAPSSMAGGRGEIHHSGLEYDQRRGFSWTAKDIIPYKGPQNLAKWWDYANQFDLIIWQVAVPTRRKENLGNTDWISLYNVPTKQIAIIHDGNFLDSYPWLHVISSHLTGLACVHTCAYNSARSIGVPSALIVNPFFTEGFDPDISRSGYFRRHRGFLSVQTWKAWKRVPELLKALPYAKGLQRKLVAGKGIDYYYLTSKDKGKYPGVWQGALDAGMEYLDVITNAERDTHLSNVVLSVDASWSKKYGAIGAHFNRVQVEALLRGAIPVVRDLAIGHQKDDVFRDMYNCLSIPWDASPGEFGHLLTEYAYLPYDQYFSILANGLDTAKMFDRKVVAGQFITLANGFYTQLGLTSEKVRLDGYSAITEFFNAK